MKADEYDPFIADPEVFYMRTYMPRAFGALSGWAMLPTWFASMELPMIPALMIPAGLPPVLLSSRPLSMRLRPLWNMPPPRVRPMALMAELGLPALPGALPKPPSHHRRYPARDTRHHAGFVPPAQQAAGWRGPHLPIAVPLGVQTATGQNNPFVFIPLHKGADGFMSNADFKKFYWPTLKATILGLINEGLVPFLFVEGGYNSAPGHDC